VGVVVVGIEGAALDVVVWKVSATPPFILLASAAELLITVEREIVEISFVTTTV
jgi:hypothetical protein